MKQNNKSNDIASNKKAYFDYFIEEQYEAGIELKGCEVKSIKQGQVSIKEGYVKIIKGEVVVINMYVKNYEYSKVFIYDERRTRKLLLNKKEIKKLFVKITTDGYTLVPLKVYNKNGLIKVKIGLAKGKKQHDKREVLAKKSANRDIERTLKERNNKY